MRISPRNSRRIFYMALILILVCAPGLLAQVVSVQPQSPAPTAENGVATNETGSVWFVELTNPPVADGTALTTVKQDKKSFRAAAAAAKINYKERFAYDNLFNGMSIKADATEISKVARIPGVVAVYPVGTYQMPITRAVSDPDLITALSMTGADIVQNQLGFTGRGVKVGIIDTGVDYAHPDLGGDGVSGDFANFPTNRVVTGWDFVGDAYDANAASPIVAPDPYPYDCAGHGTHVAGIVGANGAVVGVAPNVTFGAYRVFGCSGSTADDIMIAAMERALADGMQVVNMSIGASFGWPEWPTAKAATRLVNKGVVVVASIGNDGTSGIYAGSAPGLGTKVIGVASFDNTHLNLSSFTYSPANSSVGYISATGAPAAPLSGAFPLAHTGSPSTTDDGCTASAPGTFTGQIVLIRRGTCSFYQKSLNAMNAGAAGVILYNNTTGIVSPTVAGSPAIAIPVVSVSALDGAAIDASITGGGSTMAWTSAAVSLPNATGGLISSFSSYGIAPDLTLKPDIGAPGGFIRSTYPLALGSYANLSGTSMSSPHVAGAVALLLEALPRTGMQAVRDILENNAAPAAWWGNPSLGFLDNTHRQGAGMLQIDKAILNTTRVSPGKLSLGESQAGPLVQELTITNRGRITLTYDLNSVGALSTGPNAFTPSFLTGFAAVSFTKGGVPVTSVTIPAQSSKTVCVKITAETLLPDDSLFGGYITITPRGTGEAIHVPYSGLKGDYQAIPVLTPTPNGFPWLAKLSGTTLTNEPTGATYTLQGGDLPYFLLHFDHQAALLQMEVFDANSGKAWHKIVKEKFLPRNTTSTGFFTFTWDGMTFNGNNTKIVPNGQYVVKVSVVKALGDPDNLADTETWTSPVITLARP